MALGFPLLALLLGAHWVATNGWLGSLTAFEAGALLVAVALAEQVELPISSRTVYTFSTPITILAAGTDGTDGPTNAAGGIVDGSTIDMLKAAGADADEMLARYDSYAALARADARLETGPTDTNVTDLHLLAVEGKSAAGRKKR